ncbi:MAG: hypothetical protein IPH38_18495 [Candidatus Microthrix sp.]|nr:hypothetical protein [Candidatus Microthrix sp.]MBK7021524.1 hypothetical protein [Candidatus Microthrix sp.]
MVHRRTPIRPDGGEKNWMAPLRRAPTPGAPLPKALPARFLRADARRGASSVGKRAADVTTDDPEAAAQLVALFLVSISCWTADWPAARTGDGATVLLRMRGSLVC